MEKKVTGCVRFEIIPDDMLFFTKVVKTWSISGITDHVQECGLAIWAARAFLGREPIGFPFTLLEDGQLTDEFSETAKTHPLLKLRIYFMENLKAMKRLPQLIMLTKAGQHDPALQHYFSEREQRWEVEAFPDDGSPSSHISLDRHGFFIREMREKWAKDNQAHVAEVAK